MCVCVCVCRYRCVCVCVCDCGCVLDCIPIVISICVYTCECVREIIIESVIAQKNKEISNMCDISLWAVGPSNWAFQEMGKIPDGNVSFWVIYVILNNKVMVMVFKLFDISFNVHELTSNFRLSFPLFEIELCVSKAGHFRHFKMF